MAARPDILTRFGLRIRELRAARKLSQETLADKCGMDRTYLSGIERGRRNVALRNIEAIAKALGLGIDDLFNGL